MAWTIRFTSVAKKQLSKLDRQIADLITRFLDEKIASADDAREYGHALIGDQKGRWRYRVGDYRILCELRHNELIVIVISIGHRREVYR